VILDFGDALRATLEENLARFDRRSVSIEGRHPAAVALVVMPDAAGQAGVVLTVRASGLRRHGGQWALPGGRLDPGETPEQAALRELEEELGLTLPPEHLLGRLDDYPTRSGFVITPVVMAGPGAVADLVPSPDEVSELFHITFDELDVEPRYLTIEESPRPVVQMPLVGHYIHAPTGAVLLQFREVALHGRTTRVDGLEQPVFAWR
jgi:8-oxo-dGTP pyrophosphatase MutT (NUDIX family)